MKTMTTRSHTLIFQFLLALMILSPQARLHAQAGAEDTNAPANPAPAQAPDEMTKKITNCSLSERLIDEDYDNTVAHFDFPVSSGVDDPISSGAAACASRGRGYQCA